MVEDFGRAVMRCTAKLCITVRPFITPLPRYSLAVDAAPTSSGEAESRKKAGKEPRRVKPTCHVRGGASQGGVP